MGLYINPSDQSKERWLRHNASQLLTHRPQWSDIPEDKMVVCLVNNGPFTAAAVCYNERELEGFGSPTDQRQKDWLLVDKDKLKQVCPDFDNYVK